MYPDDREGSIKVVIHCHKVSSFSEVTVCFIHYKNWGPFVSFVYIVGLVTKLKRMKTEVEYYLIRLVPNFQCRKYEFSLSRPAFRRIRCPWLKFELHSFRKWKLILQRRGRQCRHVSDLTHVLRPAWPGTAFIPLQIEISYIMFKERRDEKEGQADGWSEGYASIFFKELIFLS